MTSFFYLDKFLFDKILKDINLDVALVVLPMLNFMHVVIVIFLNRSCFKNNEEINVPKRPIFWKMCSDLKQDIRKSWDLHTIVQAEYEGL